MATKVYHPLNTKSWILGCCRHGTMAWPQRDTNLSTEVQMKNYGLHRIPGLATQDYQPFQQKNI